MARGDGLRVQLSAIDGLTGGKTKGLLTPQFRFQCPPLDSFSHDHGHNHIRSTNYQGRETSRRSKRKLITVPLRTLVVEYASWAVEQRWDVEDMLEAFEVIAEEGYPFRLLATHKYNGRAEVDITAVMDPLTITEQAGEQDARYLDMTFTEKDDVEVSRASNRRSGVVKDYPYTITLRKDGTYTASSPAFKTKGEPLTLEVVARYAYGAASLAGFVGSSQRPPLTDWGTRTAIVRHSRFKNGGKLTVPRPPDVRTDHGGSVPRRPPVTVPALG